MIENLLFIMLGATSLMAAFTYYHLKYKKFLKEHPVLN
jgi:hypothetical protein